MICYAMLYYFILPCAVLLTFKLVDAAPETFPPDTFNAGFMVITPSEDTFQRLLRANERVGSAEGGDQVTQHLLSYGNECAFIYY